jgi:hypothetical protein
MLLQQQAERREADDGTGDASASEQPAEQQQQQGEAGKGDGTPPKTEFFGLIITRLREASMSESEILSERQRLSQRTLPLPLQSGAAGMTVPLADDYEDDEEEPGVELQEDDVEEVDGDGDNNSAGTVRNDDSRLSWLSGV